MKTYEQHYEDLLEKPIGVRSKKELTNLWALLHYLSHTQDSVLNLVEAVRVLSRARKANPYLIRLEKEEEALYQRLKELDEVGK